MLRVSHQSRLNSKKLTDFFRLDILLSLATSELQRQRGGSALDTDNILTMPMTINISYIDYLRSNSSKQVIQRGLQEIHNTNYNSLSYNTFCKHCFVILYEWRVWIVV